jgi:hypothetical protein
VVMKDEMGELPVLYQDAYATHPDFSGSTVSPTGVLRTLVPSFFATWTTVPVASTT